MQRYDSWSEPRADGAYVRWSDVSDLLARIRAAVAEERGVANSIIIGINQMADFDETMDLDRALISTRAALVALLEVTGV